MKWIEPIVFAKSCGNLAYRRTDGRTDRRTDRRTDGRTDGQTSGWIQYTPFPPSVERGIINQSRVDPSQGTKTLPSLFGDVLTPNPSRHTATRICFIVSLAINNFAYVSTDHPYSKWLTRSREISWHLENSNGKTGVIGRIIHYGCDVENCRAGKPWSHVTSPNHYWFNSLRPSDAYILN